MSPTSRTLDYLRKDGWTVQKVEHFNVFAKVRVDLFGVIDLLAIRPGRTLGVQATSGANTAARVAKAFESDKLKIWLEAGNEFEVHGWRKLVRGKKRAVWEPHIVTLAIVGGQLTKEDR